MNRKHAYIYIRKTETESEDAATGLKHEKVVWKKETYIKRFPALLKGAATVNTLFSNNFKYYFDFDYESTN